MNILYKLLLLDGGESSDGNAPVNTILPSITGTLIVGQTLTRVAGTWTADLPITTTWVWKSNGVAVQTGGATYIPLQSDAGQTITIVETASDDDGSASATSAGSYIIDAEAQAHYDRVIADGGTIPLGLTALNEFVVSVKNNYSVASVNTAMWALKPHWGISGIKTASGTGATAGGRATSVLYDICGANGDFIQTTASAQPLALVHSGVNYYWCPLSVVDNMSTPNSVANQITGDIELIFNFNYYTVTNAIFISKRSGGTDISYAVRTQFQGKPEFVFTQNGSTTITSTSSVAITTSTNWLKVTRTQSNGDVVFYTSTNGTTWAQLGTTQSTASGNIFSGTAPLLLGQNAFNGSDGMGGVMYRATISNTIGGAPVVDFNPASYNRATSQTSWVSATGETWTLNTASTNNALKAAIVDQTMIMGNGTSYGMRAPSLNINDTAITSYTVFRKFVNTTGFQAISELGASTASGQGKLLLVGNTLNQEDFGIRADVGLNTSSFTSNSLSLKVATYINNIANANESLPYLIDNVSQTFISKPFISNNTTSMNATGYNFLARNNASSAWANVIATGDIVVKGEDDNTKRTAMYNLLKTLSNI